MARLFIKYKMQKLCLNILYDVLKAMYALLSKQGLKGEE